MCIWWFWNVSFVDKCGKLRHGPAPSIFGSVTIVWVGSTIEPTSMPSKPIIDRSRGTLRASFLALRMIASARKSLDAKIPVMDGFSMRNCFNFSVKSSKFSLISRSFGIFSLASYCISAISFISLPGSVGLIIFKAKNGLIV